MVDLSEYLDLYLETARSYLEALKTNLEIFHSDTSNTSSLDILHRSAHSLKSQSLVMGYLSTGTLCMEAEYIFRAIKDKKAEMSQQLYIEMKNTIDGLSRTLKSIKESHTEIDLSAEKKKLIDISDINCSKFQR